jgi:hypothetical protein
LNCPSPLPVPSILNAGVELIGDVTFRPPAASPGPTRCSVLRLPDWKFDRLREEYPDGRYEAAADIGPDEWNTLRVDVHGTTATVIVNNVEILTVKETKAPPVIGDIGLFVDIGTEAYFSNLRGHVAALELRVSTEV